MDSYTTEHLKETKTKPLKKTRETGKDIIMRLSDEGKGDLQWGINNLSKQRGHIRVAPPSMLLTTDSSLTGWGAVCLELNKAEIKTQGLWIDADRQRHRNYLKLRAIMLGLQSLLPTVGKDHVRIMSDNTTAVSCITNLESS